MGYVSRLTSYPLSNKKLFLGFLASAGLGTVFNVLTPLVIAEIIDNVIPNLRYDLIFPYALLYILLAGLYALFDAIGRYGAALSSQGSIYQMRSELYQALMEKDLSFYDANETGQLLSRVTTDVTTMREFLYWGYRVIFIGLATLIGTYYMMWTLNQTLTLYMLPMIGIVGLFMYVFARKVRPYFYEARSRYGELSSVLAENIVGMKVVKSYAAKGREQERVRAENIKFRNVAVEAYRKLAFYHPLLPTIFGIAVGVLLYFGGISLAIPEFSIGKLIAFITLVGMLVLPARFLSWGVGMYQRSSAAAERTFYILDHKDKLVDPKDPVEVTNFEGRVEYRNVYFSYGGENYILRGVSLDVKPGQVIALLGGTGSGKTSLVNLIPRFYDVDTDPVVEYNGRVYRVHEDDSVEIDGEKYHVLGGRVEIQGETLEVIHPGSLLIDGIDVRGYALDDIRENIGMVHQDPFLFSATIQENIAFADPDASVEKVQDVAKAARIHDHIMTLDEGYDSVVGERGVTLSGGQKQRIAIARALLADPRILILDDSTSSVDAKTEMMIQQALEHLMVGRTTFIITHRLSTIRNADLIVMMEKGKIVEMGSHQELIQRDGLYASIHNTLTEMEIAASLPDEELTATAGGGAPDE